jgi:hypothetical protein
MIPATQEVKTGRTAIQGQPRQKISKTLSQPVSQAQCPNYTGGISRWIIFQG